MDFSGGETEAPTERFADALEAIAKIEKCKSDETIKDRTITLAEFASLADVVQEVSNAQNLNVKDKSPSRYVMKAREDYDKMF